MKIKYIWILLIFIGFIACDDEDYSVPDTSVELVSGSADFSNYVAIGNSLTSGFTDGALFQAGQNNSLPNILSQKMSLIGGGEFSQPFTNDNIGGLLLGGVQIQNPRLYFDGSGPALIDAIPTTEVSSINPGPYNNMGVPGAKAIHLLANGYGNIAGLAAGLANPYYVRMASSSNASVLEDAMAQNPTFFSLWIGHNDVLGYAATGGDGSDPITDQATFDFAYSTLVSTLTSGGAQGVVANIPNVIEAPFFTSVPYNSLDPTNPAFGPMIPTLNALFGQLNMAYAYLGVPERSIVFSETAASPMVIHDESIANISAQLNQVLIGGGLDPATAGLLSNQFGQSRQATSDDLFVLTSMNVIGTLNTEYFTQLVTAGVPQETAGQLSVNGITYPMQDKWVLLTSEQQEVVAATNSFNVKIKDLATQSGLAFIDANEFLSRLATTGVTSGGFDFTADLVFGGVFSLDGLHLTARGSALVADEMLKAIDATYGSNFEAASELNDLGELPVFYPVGLR